MQILLQLFLTFVFIGILNFGGGYAHELREGDR